MLPELEPATHYIEMDPGVANADDSGLADDLASADIAILSTIWDDWDEPNDSREIGSAEAERVLDATSSVSSGTTASTTSCTGSAAEHVGTRLVCPDGLMRVALIVTPTYLEAAEHRRVPRRAREPRCPTPTSSSSTTTAPTAPPTSPTHAAAELGQIEVLRRPEEDRPRRRVSRRVHGRHRTRLRLPGADRRRPLARPDRAPLPARETVDDGADIVIGSRYVPGGSIPHWPWLRRALSKWGNRYTTFVLGMPISDATSGYRVYRADTSRSVDYATTRGKGYGFQIELAYRVWREGGTIEQIPIVFTDRVRGHSKMTLAHRGRGAHRSSPGGASATASSSGLRRNRPARDDRVSPPRSSWYSASTFTAQMSCVGAEDVLDREHRGEHRVVLVVVPVHAVAADRIHVPCMFARATRRASRHAPCTPRRRTDTPSAFARRSPLRPASGRADRSRASSRLPVSMRSSSAIVHHSSPSFTNNSRPEAGAAVLHEIGRPPAEVLDAADLHVGVVDVDPVVGEAVGLGDHERDRDEVAVAQRVRGRDDVGRHRRVHRAEERGDRHRRDDVRCTRARSERRR